MKLRQRMASAVLLLCTVLSGIPVSAADPGGFDVPVIPAGAEEDALPIEELFPEFTCPGGCEEPELITIDDDVYVPESGIYTDFSQSASSSGWATELEAYNDDYAYRCFASESKGAAKQEFYNRIDSVAVRFHNDYTQNGNPEYADKYGLYYAGIVEFASLGLTQDEANIVMRMYRNDHPLYYWLYSLLGNGKSLWITTTEEYDQGSERRYYNDLIKKKIAEYMKLVEDETSGYQIALAIHDTIAETIDYAYKADGETPADTRAAHNILGVLAEEGPVCESYARAFQLLLNAAGVECLYVTGNTKEGETGRHAWNLVKLDDGQWYWYDPTWGDAPDWLWGVKHNYFCVNDEQNTNWYDNSGIMTARSFLKDHIPETPDGSLYLYPLPARSPQPYAARGKELRLRDTFLAGNLYYSVVGNNRVQCVAFQNIDGDLVIPDTVEYNGIRYDVISVGGLRSDGLFGTGAMGYSGSAPETVTIGGNVRYIWGYAFRYNTVKSFTADPGNRYYSAKDGVLYTKKGYTLVDYPDASSAAAFTVPDETSRIFYNAFYKCSSLEDLTIGNNVSVVGVNGSGKPYHDNIPDAKLSRTSGGWYSIHSGMAGAGNIEIAPGNKKFFRHEDGFYENIEGGTKFLLFPYKLQSSQPVSLLGSTIAVDYAAFTNCGRLRKVIIPSGVSALPGYTFGYCYGLTEVYFMGDCPTGPEKAGSTVFKGISSDTLTIYYNPSASGWTDCTWLADDGTPFKIKPFPDTHLKGGWEFTDQEHWKSCSCGKKHDAAPHFDSDRDGFCDACEYRTGRTVRGKITSYGTPADSIRIELIPAGGTEALITLTLPGDASEYALENVVPGEYILRIGQKNHISREYRFTLN